MPGKTLKKASYKLIWGTDLRITAFYVHLTSYLQISNHYCEAQKLAIQYNKKKNKKTF